MPGGCRVCVPRVEADRRGDPRAACGCGADPGGLGDCSSRRLSEASTRHQGLNCASIKICEKCDPPHSRLGHRSDRKSVPAGCTRHPKGGRHAEPASLDQKRAEGRTRQPRARHAPSPRTPRAPACEARCCRKLPVFRAAPFASRQRCGQRPRARPTRRVAE